MFFDMYCMLAVNLRNWYSMSTCVTGKLGDVYLNKCSCCLVCKREWNI